MCLNLCLRQHELLVVWVVPTKERITAYCDLEVFFHNKCLPVTAIRYQFNPQMDTALPQATNEAMVHFTRVVSEDLVVENR